MSNTRLATNFGWIDATAFGDISRVYLSNGTDGTYLGEAKVLFNHQDHEGTYVHLEEGERLVSIAVMTKDGTIEVRPYGD